MVFIGSKLVAYALSPTKAFSTSDSLIINVKPVPTLTNLTYLSPNYLLLQ